MLTLPGGEAVAYGLRGRIFKSPDEGETWTAVKQGGEEEWNFGWERYKKSNVGSEKAALLGALSCTQETWLLNKYLNMSLTSGSGIRQQDGLTVVSKIASTTAGRDLAFDYVRDQFPVVYKKYGGSSFSMGGLVKNVLKNRNTRFDVDEVEENFKTLICFC